MKPECPPLRVSLKVKGADGRSWRRVESIYEEIPRRFSKKKFLAKGVLPSGLTPSFHTNKLFALWKKCLSSACRTELQAFSSHLVPFTFPRPGIEGRRRVAHILNPILAVRMAVVISEHWGKFRRKLSEKKNCLFETSLPIIDQEGLRYLSPALTHTKLSTVLESIHLIYPSLIKFDIQSFYPSIYTHSLEWAMVGKAAAKRKCDSCSEKQKKAYKAGQQLDSAIRNGQNKETYGLPIGPDSSFLAAELVGKSIALNLVSELKKSGLDDFFLVRHVDDFALFVTGDVQRAVGVVRRVLRAWNLLPNELKIDISENSHEGKSNWTYKLSSFSSDGEIIERSLSAWQSKIAGRNKLVYQEIDYWNLERYLSLAYDLQMSYPSKSVVTYALRRLHLNTRIRPGKSYGHGYYGRPYLMNFKPDFYPNLDMQLSSLLVAFPSYVDVIADVYLWYLTMTGSFPVFLGDAINNLILNKLDPIEHHFEVLWLLWIARYFLLPLKRDAVVLLLENVHDPIVALQLLDYVIWWQEETGISLSGQLKSFRERINDSRLSLYSAATLQEAFLREDWIFHYSLHFAPDLLLKSWAAPIDSSEPKLRPILEWMLGNDVQFFRWGRYVRPVDRYLGVSRKGRGGISARPYPF